LVLALIPDALKISTERCSVGVALPPNSVRRYFSAREEQERWFLNAVCEKFWA
jgi:hypothetical protein